MGKASKKSNKALGDMKSDTLEKLIEECSARKDSVISSHGMDADVNSEIFSEACAELSEQTITTLINHYQNGLPVDEGRQQRAIRDLRRRYEQVRRDKQEPTLFERLRLHALYEESMTKMTEAVHQTVQGGGFESSLKTCRRAIEKWLPTLDDEAQEMVALKYGFFGASYQRAADLSGALSFRMSSVSVSRKCKEFACEIERRVREKVQEEEAERKYRMQEIIRSRKERGEASAASRASKGKLRQKNERGVGSGKK